MDSRGTRTPVTWMFPKCTCFVLPLMFRERTVTKWRYLRWRVWVSRPVDTTLTRECSDVSVRIVMSVYSNGHYISRPQWRVLSIVYRGVWNHRRLGLLYCVRGRVKGHFRCPLLTLPVVKDYEDYNKDPRILTFPLRFPEKWWPPPRSSEVSHPPNKILWL